MAFLNQIPKLMILTLGLLQVITVQAAELPQDLVWQTNNTDPTFAATEAQRGGQFDVAIPTYPLTFRVVGPDANSVLYTALISNNWSLTTMHPNTDQPIPLLATHWAYGKDGRTIYYKINPKARWSDGKPVVADDFIFALEFMLSPNIKAPWYNNYYSETYEKIEKYDDHTISITLKMKKPNLIEYCDIAPIPKHFYKGKVPKDFVRRYNWKVVPNTGPYIIKSFKRGKSVTMERKPDWWGNDLRYFKHRYNIDKVVFKVVRETEVEYQWFSDGKISSFVMMDPKYWYERAEEVIYKKGYVHKLWFYNDAPRSTYGLWLNTSKPIFQDINMRLAFQHAINFDRVIKELLRNEYERMPGVSPGYRGYSNPKIKARPYDLKKADEYFKKAGWIKRNKQGIRLKNGQSLTVELVYASDEWTPRLLILQEDAKKAGIELKLRRLDWSTVLKIISSWKHDIVLMGFGAGKYPTYWQTWHSKSKDNLTKTIDPKLDKMIEQYRSSTSVDERKKLSQEIQMYIHNLASFIPSVMTTFTRLGYWRWLRLPSPPGTRISSNPLALFDEQTGGLVWFDQGLYKETQEAIKKGKAFKPVTVIDETYRVH